ncbi:DECREASED DNA METHYLATION 1 family protein [Heracleum sosnowskyi]|uniref:DECREASED DNA METHYLATION 1 family protein n=1 Tax=Heracleum sosnowskyi TaxID=360622 RepID=A0AAD8M7U8_9APIA|nr:DECREASED DNA METHYLATION 1 family protein [Heracleum sosnowskyi]
MAKAGKKFVVLRSIASGFLLIASVIVSAEQGLKQETAGYSQTPEHIAETKYLLRVVNFLWQEGQQGYVHVWPEMKLGWRIIVGSIIGFLGAALGSVGGVGGGGIYVPMLTLIVEFDAKSSTALSKCMITGVAGATVYYNLKLRHPTLNLPIIDCDLALLFQPMLVLGISIGVALNVMFADWMVTMLLIVLFIVTSTKAFLKGVETWKLETMVKKEAMKHLASNGNEGDGEAVAYTPLPGCPSNNSTTTSNESKTSEISLFGNICWKELGILVAVWVIILALQLAKNHMEPCSPIYWVWNLLQIPVAVGASEYEAICLYTGRRVIASKAGMVGGLLGLGGGFILGPLFLELGIPPQVSSATATFAMTFSAMSVVEYYLLKHFPVPYALYFVATEKTSNVKERERKGGTFKSSTTEYTRKWRCGRETGNKAS